MTAHMFQVESADYNVANVLLLLSFVLTLQQVGCLCKIWPGAPAATFFIIFVKPSVLHLYVRQ